MPNKDVQSPPSLEGAPELLENKTSEVLGEIDEIELEKVALAAREEELAAKWFINEVVNDGPAGQEAAAEMGAVAEEAVALERSWIAGLKRILTNPVAEYRAYQEEKKTIEYSIEDNPKVWEELNKRRYAVSREIFSLREKVAKKKTKDLQFLTNNAQLIERLKNLLTDYQSFNKSDKFAREKGSAFAGHEVEQMVKVLLDHDELDTALELWKMSPGGNHYTVDALLSKINPTNKKNYNEIKALLKAELGREPEHAEVIAFRNQERLECSERAVADHPDLQVAVWIYQNDDHRPRLNKFPEKWVALLEQLVKMPDRAYTLSNLSPFTEEVMALVSPELKKELFSFCLRHNFKVITDNITFFNEEFSSISAAERGQVIDLIANQMKGAYAGTAGYRPSKSPGWLSGSDRFNEVKRMLRAFTFITLTSAEQEEIVEALGMPEHRLKSYKKSDRQSANDAFKQGGYDNLLADLWDNFPEAIDRNGAVLVQTSTSNDSTEEDPKTQTDVFLSAIIKQERTSVVEAVWDKQAALSPEQRQSVVEYLVAADYPKGLEHLCKAMTTLENVLLSLPIELQRKIVDGILTGGITSGMDYILNNNKDSSPLAFAKLNPEQEERFFGAMMAVEDDDAFAKFFHKISNFSEDIKTRIPKVQAMYAYTQSFGICDRQAVSQYVGIYLKTGPEAAEAFVIGIKERVKAIIGKDIPKELRKAPEYQLMVKYVFPDGNYSTYEKNLALGDKTGHLSGYKYNKDGYAVELTGLLGYGLRTVEKEAGGTEVLQDDAELLSQYQKRFKGINDFVASRGPDNESLRGAFDKKVSDLFAQFAAPEFKDLADLAPKEKMLILFVTEALRRTKDPEFKPNQPVLDLVVEYKYAYHENLGNYVQQSAHDVEQQRDAVSQRYLLWQELSNIYGENVKHVLRHNIFEELSENGKNYEEIIRTFDGLVSASSETFELSAREQQSVRSIFEKKIPDEEKYGLVLEKLADLFGPQLKLKGDDDKKAQQQRQYDEERGVFMEKLQVLFAPHAGELDETKVSEVMAGAYKINPRQLARFENTFDNKQILVEDTILPDGKPKDGKYKVLMKQVLDMFGSNIKFKDETEYANFEQTAAQIMEPIQQSLSKEEFIALIPKLKTLRNQYRSGINAKLEELFTLDLNAINREIAKFEEIVETEAKETQIGGAKHKEIKKSGKKRKIRTFISKTQETANARMGAYLCLAGDEKMWANKNYFEAVDKDEETGKCVGLTMYLNIEAKSGKKYLWIGPNPFESFLTQVSAEKAFDHQYSVAVEFAEKNGYDGIVVPPEDSQILGACTNRGGNFPDLIKAKRLRDKKNDLKIVDFGKEHSLGLTYGYSSGALLWEKK